MLLLRIQSGEHSVHTKDQDYYERNVSREWPDPYRQAYKRGVKIIAATAHYVTADLDEGPIIEQALEKIDHNLGIESLIQIGRDAECAAFA